MSHFESCLNRRIWRSKKVVQVVQIRVGGGEYLDKIQKNSYFFVKPSLIKYRRGAFVTQYRFRLWEPSFGFFPSVFWWITFLVELKGSKLFITSYLLSTFAKSFFDKYRELERQWFLSEWNKINFSSTHNRQNIFL